MDSEIGRRGDGEKGAKIFAVQRISLITLFY